jgi:acyl-CoA dehydrogenase
MALTFSRFTDVPVTGPTRRYYQHINRFSAAFSLASDAAMLTLGGELKRQELLSARLGDVLSDLYMASMVLKHFRDQGEPVDDLPLVEWSCRTLLYHAQEQLHSLLRNFPNRPIAFLLRILVFPRGRTFSAPSDALGRKIVDRIVNPTPTRNRLAPTAYLTREPTNQLALLQELLEMADDIKPLERRVFDARRRGEITVGDTPGQIEAAERLGVLTGEEAQRIRDFDARVLELTGVDDFDPAELHRKDLGSQPSAKKAGKKSARKKANDSAEPDDA